MTENHPDQPTNDHDHDHDQSDHVHDSAEDVITARVKALESILIEKGLLSTEAVDRLVEIYEHEVGPQLGAKLVAKAWVDPAFRDRLLSDARSACSELGIAVDTETLVVVPNSEEVHNVIVCTLCSCYPWAVLGLPPTWYKSPAYRASIVRNPRSVLEESFDLIVPPTKEIRVWDSSSDLRYFVLPERPAGTEGWSEEDLAALASRDSMLGVGTALEPGAGSIREELVTR